MPTETASVEQEPLVVEDTPQEDTLDWSDPSLFDVDYLMDKHGITKPTVEEWKQTIETNIGRKLPIEAIALHGELFIFRPMLRAEYREMMSKVTGSGPSVKIENEDFMVSNCLVWSSVPVESLLNNGEAGFVAILAEHISLISKFLSPSLPKRL